MSVESSFRLHESEGNKKIAAHYPQSFSLTEGKPITPVPHTEFGVYNGSERAQIYFDKQKPSQFFRGLFLLASHPAREAFGEIPRTEVIGVSIDDARGSPTGGGTYKPEYIAEEVIPRLALLGYTHLMWYIENPLRSNPQIDRKDLQDTARTARSDFGIELFPATQTFTHAASVLEQEACRHMATSEGTYDLNNPDTYAFFETELLPAAQELFGSCMMNIGCDEIIKLGGNKALLLPHGKKMAEILSRLGMKGMIWGDELEGLPEEELKQFFDVFQPIIAYWDYETEDPEVLGQKISYFRQLGLSVYMISGMQDWNRFDALYEKSEANIAACALAASASGAEGMFVSSWGDGSHKAPLWGDMYGFLLHAEYMYNGNTDPQVSDERLFTLTGERRETFIEAGKMERLFPADAHVIYPPTMAQALLYEEVLTHPFSGSVPQIHFTPVFTKRYHRLAAIARNAPPIARHTRLRQAALADVLRVKADLGKNIKLAYLTGNRQGLKEATKQASLLVGKVGILADAHEAEWQREKNPAGFVKLCRRYQTVQQDLIVAEQRLGDYLAGTINSIEELEKDPPPQNAHFVEGRVWYTDVISGK